MDELVMHKECEHVENITDAILALAQDTGISRVCVHTKEYVISVVARGFIEPDDELDALFFVIKKATSLASRGKPDVSYAPECVTSTNGAMYLQEVLSSHGSGISGASTKNLIMWLQPSQIRISSEFLMNTLKHLGTHQQSLTIILIKAAKNSKLWQKPICTMVQMQRYKMEILNIIYLQLIKT